VAVRRSLIDLTPTILDLFGVSTEPGALRGTSWLAELSDPAEAKKRPVFIDMPAGPYNGERQAYIEDDIKITTSNTRTMGVFDLAKDPGEKDNLMKDAELAQRVHARYLEFRRGLEPVKVKPR
jgi:arylsulfatase A-like enzyme